MCASRQLLLSDNALSGTIPSNLSAMSVLTYLSMGNNRVTGSIPATVGSISRLAWMSVSGNALNGTLPSTLTGMAALGYVAAWVTTPVHLCVTTDGGTHRTRLCVLEDAQKKRLSIAPTVVVTAGRSVRLNLVGPSTLASTTLAAWFPFSAPCQDSGASCQPCATVLWC